MDASTEAHLRAFSQGQSSSRQVREQTGLHYSEMLDALAGLGLRLPSFDYETADEEVQRGHDNFLAYLIAHKGPQESAAGKPSPPQPVIETRMNGNLSSRATDYTSQTRLRHSSKRGKLGVVATCHVYHTACPTKGGSAGTTTLTPRYT